MGKFNRTTKAIIPITTDGTIKDAGDVVGGLLSQVVSAPQSGYRLRDLVLVDDANQAAALTIYIFDDAPTNVVDDAAFAATFTIGDHKKLRRVIAVASGTDYTVINSNATCIKSGLDVDICSPTGTIYIYIVCTATPTYGASDLTLILHGYQE